MGRTATRRRRGTNGRMMPTSQRAGVETRRERRTPLEGSLRRRSRNIWPALAADKITSGQLFVRRVRLDSLNARALRRSVNGYRARDSEGARCGWRTPAPMRSALQALQDTSPPDQARIERKPGNQLVWETRIFECIRRGVIKLRLRGADRSRPAPVRARPAALSSRRSEKIG